VASDGRARDRNRAGRCSYDVMVIGPAFDTLVTFICARVVAGVVLSWTNTRPSELPNLDSYSV
jgi:hypothetical protein